MESTIKVDLAEEDEKELPPATGWTIDAVKKFFTLKSNIQKIQLVKDIFSISDSDYSFKETSTFIVDFHAGNAAFCVDSNFNAEQTLFICDSFSVMLEDAVAVANEENLNFDSLRNTLARRFKVLFTSNAPEFEVHQVESSLQFIVMTFLKPLRLILRQFQQPPYSLQVLELKKMFSPIIPFPLSEFTEMNQISEFEFHGPIITQKNISKISEQLEKYQNGIKEMAEKRIDALNCKIKILTEQLHAIGLVV